MAASLDFERRARLGGLRRFAIAITVLNLLGHTVLGFEQSWAQLGVALFTAYAMEIGTELLNAWSACRPSRLSAKPREMVDFLLSAHITGLAVSMLIYADDNLPVFAFGVVCAMGSKTLFRLKFPEGSRHFLNPSNFGISMTLLLNWWVGMAPQYEFTEKLDTSFHWLLPLAIIGTGSFLNSRFTHRMPVIGAWVGGFFLQALIRAVLTGTDFVASIAPMTGVAFVIYTFYMVTDPATTPGTTRLQLLFGASVAAMYGLLMAVHIPNGLFFSLTLVCLGRGAIVWACARNVALFGRWRPMPAIAGAPR